MLWDELAARAPVAELRPCVLCDDIWPPAALDARTRLCPACTEEILGRQSAEASAVAPVDDLEVYRRRAEERRRAEFEEARRKLRELAATWDDDLFDPEAISRDR